jgi:hypothetical protein
VIDKLYRYDGSVFDNHCRLFLTKYQVLRKTPRGVWIDTYGQEKFVLLDAHKRYVCPTPEEAMVSFIARKKRQIRILTMQLARAKIALETAQSGKTKYTAPALAISLPSGFKFL